MTDDTYLYKIQNTKLEISSIRGKKQNKKNIHTEYVFHNITLFRGSYRVAH